MQVPIHKFKAHLAQYIEHAQSDVIELTSHSKVVARVIGVGQSEHAGISRLLAAGVATWQGGKPAGASLVLTGGGRAVSETVLEDRG